MKNNTIKTLIFDIEPYYKAVYKPSDGSFNIFSYSSHAKGRILKQYVNKYGYLAIKLGGRTCLVHQIISERFVGDKIRGYTVNHKDGNKSNNSISNLEYITISENIKHSVKNGLHVSAHPERHGHYKDGRALKSRIKLYKHEWYETKKSK